ncbi:stage II sporulation protein GA (sporulation sigma-E factor processing peptidase) [Caldanaerobius fijiensis DSM 17918]|uniref:Sporulation sigma-E factor-processing peptidase n=1 Tax=Caldanaerobius fijiensis DSM 17918 TaxID=1121256 RepID=A0A1M4T1R1_9THEO|nr:sigma-E processing peptidase SpoIIGA [Caldanaerobius fijiensis]SHE38340.1 stage II sporulation protein GA (sporulation sigma-E factor processing peptidase) [Caldanaerobius fijiensis DSM 17918]
MYIDLLFIENLLMNYIILVLTAKLGKFDFKGYKLLIASAAGSLYVIIMYLPHMGFMRDFTAKVMLSMLMVIIAFTPAKIKFFFQEIIVFYMVAFIFGGASIAIYYLIGDKQVIRNGMYYSAMGVAFVVVAIKLGLNYIHGKINKNKLNISLKVTIEGKSNEMIGLVDTGNSLYEPLSHWPVIIVEFKKIKELLPDSIRELYLKGLDMDLGSLTVALANTNWGSRVRMIPFSSLGRENGMLLGFKPDSVLIKGTEEKEVKNVIVAIYNNSLSKNQEYGALLHPDIL